jgi:hypothetical protein
MLPETIYVKSLSDILPGWKIIRDESPFFKHDCSFCTHRFSVKTFHRSGWVGKADVYRQCNQDSPNDILIRFSSKGSDYMTNNTDSLIAENIFNRLEKLETL